MTKYLNQTNKPGALIALDFSKVFDTLSKPCILDALEMFKFEPKFQNLVNTVMKNTKSCVHNGGWVSSSFSVERGIRQGCPLSPLLFIVAVEVLAIKIRNSSEIEGIKIRDTRFYQYISVSRFKGILIQYIDTVSTYRYIEYQK